MTWEKKDCYNTNLNPTQGWGALQNLRASKLPHSLFQNTLACNKNVQRSASHFYRLPEVSFNFCGNIWKNRNLIIPDRDHYCGWF